MDIRKAAVELFGEGHTGENYIRMLAQTLKISQSGARKLWFGQRRKRQLTGTAEELVKLKLEQQQKVTPGDLVGPLTDASGNVLPDEAFENEPGDTIDQRFANLSASKRKDLLDRLDRLIAGEKGALNGFSI